MFDKDGMNQIVSAAVVSAMEEQAPKLLGELVEKVLGQEVNEHGGKPDSWSHQRMTLLEYTARNELRRIVQDTVREWVKGKEDGLRATIQTKLADGGIADAFVNAIIRDIETRDIQLDLSVRRND
jgi:hypothetical protein